MNFLTTMAAIESIEEDIREVIAEIKITREKCEKLEKEKATIAASSDTSKDIQIERIITYEKSICALEEKEAALQQKETVLQQKALIV